MSYKIECNPESHEIYIRDDEGNVVHHSHTIEQQRAALAMFIQETRQLQLESKGQQCRRTHLQNCHICDDVGCCDNTSMAKKEIDRLRSERDTAKKELEELKAKLPKTADGVTCFGGDIVYQYERDEEEDDEYVDTYMVVRDESGWSVVSYANKNLYHYELPEISECYSTEGAAREAVEAKNIPE